MSQVQQLLTEHIDIWTAADTGKKSGRGRASSNAGSVYGIRKLRELILELAVRGKLVPQNANDEPASELLKRIQAKKTVLIAEGKIKKDKPLAVIAEEEKPFELPQSWKWARLGFVGNTQTGSTPSKSSTESFGTDIPFVKPGDIYPNYVEYGNEGLSFYGAKQSGRVAESGSILMVCIGTIGKCNLIERDCSFNQQINSVTPYLFDSRYLLSVCRSMYFHSEAWSRSSSTTIAILNKGNWEEICVPVPPLAEQHRIVAKVDELMALCDQLEARHSNAGYVHEQLVSHLLGTLTQSQDAADFNTNWQRIATHFDPLFTTESSIDSLKQTLLQLAVMGKLVPQDPKDEPASELLKRIQAEKAKLIAEGKIKKDKPLENAGKKGPRFPIPSTWEWVHMADLCRPISSGSTPSAELFDYEEGVPFLKVYNIRDQEIDFDYKRQFVSNTLNETKLSRSILYPGDVLMNIVGPPLGKVAIIPDSYPRWNCNQALVFFGLIAPMSNAYVLDYLKEGSFLKDIELIGTAGQDNISVTKSKNILVPVPPLAEQHRIVAKVDELMTLCEQLKSRITDAKQCQQKLADVLIEAAVA